MGVWYGDGTKNLDNAGPSITTMDSCIVEACEDVASSFGLRVNRVVDKRGNKASRYDIIGKSGKPNPLTKALRNITSGVTGISPSIKYGSPEVRLAFLAGIIDTDGYLIHNSYDIVQKRKEYAEDIMFIARSLGFAGYLSSCFKSSQNGTTGEYYRVFISGDTDRIPVRLSHKKASPRKQKKNVRRNGFTVESLGFGDYAGFTITGDGRFLLGDFTVTHNTTALITTTKVALLANKKVLYISAELSLDQILKRFDSAMTGVPILEVKHRAEEVRDALRNTDRYKRALSNLVVHEVPMGTTTVRDLEAVLNHYINKRNWHPDLVVVDYADNLAPLKSNNLAPRLEIYSIYRDLRALGQKYKFAVWTASQLNDAGTAASEEEGGRLSTRHVNEARGKAHLADLIIGIGRTVQEHQQGLARLQLVKNRLGGYEGQVVSINTNYACSLLWTSSSPVSSSISLTNVVPDNYLQEDALPISDVVSSGPSPILSPTDFIDSITAKFS
jgi:hypothetical protein